MSQPGQMIGGGQAGGAGADDQHAFAGRRRSRRIVPAFRRRTIAEEALHRVDRHRRVHFAAIAAGFARMIADPAMSGGQRVVGYQQFPRVAVFPGLGQREPALDVLAGRAGIVAGRPQVGPYRVTGAERTGAPVERQVDNRSQVVRGAVCHG